MTSTRSCGVRIAGVGSAAPERRLTNADLEKMVDTNNEWITKRTGILERRVCNVPEEGTFTLSCEAAQRALDDAGIAPGDVDLLIAASVTSEMTCPSNACRIAAEVGIGPGGAFDLVAACSGFVYSLNVADTMIRSGRYRTVVIVGCDAMSTAVDYDERSVSILFGDAAGAAVLTADDDPDRGCIHQTLQSDGTMWRTLYWPMRDADVPDDDLDNPVRLGCLRMHGREVYKFAVSKFTQVIKEAMETTGLTTDDIAQVVAHQSNIRILESARQKLDLPEEKLYVNIDRYGNSSAGSVGLCLDQLWKAGRIRERDVIVFVAFGGGLTWASSVWRV